MTISCNSTNRVGNGPHLGQMVGVQHQGMAGDKAERVLVLLLGVDLIGGTHLFYRSGVQPGAFLQLDAGTWRRLIVVPFNARITGNGDIKNYAEYLYENAGSAILAWMIEGAKRVRLPFSSAISGLMLRRLPTVRASEDTLPL